MRYTKLRFVRFVLFASVVALLLGFGLWAQSPHATNVQARKKLAETRMIPIASEDTQRNVASPVSESDLDSVFVKSKTPDAIVTPGASINVAASAQSGQTRVPLTSSAGTGSGMQNPSELKAPESPLVVLYDQFNNPAGASTSSQNFEPANAAFNDFAADDFVVPGGQTWNVNQVEVQGVYFNGAGPAASVNVTFYANTGSNLPGAAVAGCTYSSLPFSNGSSFNISLPTNCVLVSGTYWVSVQANQNFTPAGQWGWTDRTVTSNAGAAWQNPGGGFGTPCTAWGRRGATCGIDAAAPDQVFRLSGTLGGSCNQNFDGVTAPALPTGWTAANQIQQAGDVKWVTSNAGTPAPPADTAPNSAFVDDPNHITDKWLYTPFINVTSAAATMSFQRNNNLESGFDGAVLEIEINGAAYQDIIAAGGSIPTGGYNGTISGSFGSPIAGRMAWTGNSAGFVATTVNLPAAANGFPVKFRFRMASDSSVAVQGIRIDTITFTGVSCAAPTADPATISGRITKPDGAPVGGAVMRLSGAATRTTVSDGAGNYRFNDLETGNFFTVTPELANYSFSPGSRSFSLTGNMTDAGFTAIPDGSQTANPIDTTEYFVRQQYLDFLGREPDQGGLDYWSAQINQCGDAGCVSQKRIDVSAAFFMSAEFQQTGSYIYGLYAGTLGRTLNFGEFSADRSQVVGGGGLDQAKTAFAGNFVKRSEFTAMYPESLSREQFVDAVIQTMTTRSGVDQSSLRNGLLSDYDAGGRALVVRHAAEADSFVAAEYNKAFVLMEYYGYLRRNVDQGGYAFWLDVLKRSPGNYRGMVCSFLTSGEYQFRFSTVITRSNVECQ